MEAALHNYIGAVCLWASANTDMQKKAAAYLMQVFEATLLEVEGGGWLLVIEGAFEAKRALYEGLLPIEATHAAFKRTCRSLDQSASAFAPAA